MNVSSVLFVHAAGIALIVGRLLHARGMLSDSMQMRIIGMHITFYTLIGLAVLNMVFLPYAKLLDF